MATLLSIPVSDPSFKIEEVDGLVTINYDKNIVDIAVKEILESKNLVADSEYTVTIESKVLHAVVSAHEKSNFNYTFI